MLAVPDAGMSLAGRWRWQVPHCGHMVSRLTMQSLNADLVVGRYNTQSTVMG